MVKRDFEKDILLNITQLHTEWLDYPNKYSYYSKLLTEADNIRTKTKDKMDVVKADLYLEAKTKTEEIFKGIDIKKVTEGTIDSWITTNPVYRKAVEEHQKSCYNYSILKDHLYSIDKQKYALSNLVSLWLADYFSTPRVDEKVKPKFEETGEKDFREAQLGGLQDAGLRRKKQG